MARFEEGAVVLASQGVRFWESKVSGSPCILSMSANHEHSRAAQPARGLRCECPNPVRGTIGALKLQLPKGLTNAAVCGLPCSCFQVLKVQSIGGVAQYLVHYQGWNKKFDEWVPDDRVMEATAENIKMAQEMRAKADAEDAGRKKQPGGKKKAAAGGADASAAAGASASALSGQKRKGVDVVKETVSRRAGAVV